jgi:hypothetical protein
MKYILYMKRDIIQIELFFYYHHQNPISLDVSLGLIERK